MKLKHNLLVDDPKELQIVYAIECTMKQDPSFTHADLIMAIRLNLDAFIGSSAKLKWGTNEIGSYYRTIDDYPMKIKVIAQVIKDLAIKVNPALDFETYIFLMVFAASKITNKIVGVDTIEFSYQLGDTRYA